MNRIQTPADFASWFSPASQTVAEGEGFIIRQSSKPDQFIAGLLTNAITPYLKRCGADSHIGHLLDDWRAMLDAFLASTSCWPMALSLIGEIRDGFFADALLVGKSQQHGTIAIGMSNLLDAITTVGHPVAGGLQVTTAAFKALIASARKVAGELGTEFDLVLPDLQDRKIDHHLGCACTPRKVIADLRMPMQFLSIATLKPDTATV